MKVFICSGGMDSTIMALTRGDKELDTLIFFKYGQKHAEREEAAFDEIFKGWRSIKMDLTPIFKVQTSCSLITGEIPVGNYGDETIASLEVKNRNLMFILIASSVEHATEVWYGAHKNDSVVYSDCTLDFVEAAQQVLTVQHSPVRIMSPFIRFTKSNILDFGLYEGVSSETIYKTYSCYNGRENHCGTCPTCLDRQKAFADADTEILDGTVYEH